MKIYEQLKKKTWKLMSAKPVDAFINVWPNTLLNTNAMAQHLTECEHAQFLANLQGQYDRLNNLPSFWNSSNSIKNLIFNDSKILYSSKSTNTNKLLLIEEKTKWKLKRRRKWNFRKKIRWER